MPNLGKTHGEVLRIRLRNLAVSTLESADLARDALKEIDRLDAVISDGAKWVPVEERMPEVCADVVAFTDEHEPWIAWVESDGCWSSPLGILGGVTHWMPLPEAPK